MENVWHRILVRRAARSSCSCAHRKSAPFADSGRAMWPNMCQAARNPEKQGPGADSKVPRTAGPIFFGAETPGFETGDLRLGKATPLNQLS